MTPSASRGGAEAAVAAAHSNSGSLSGGSRRDLYLMEKIHPEDPAGIGAGGRGRAGAGSSSTPPPPPRRGGDDRRHPPHPQSIVYPEAGRRGPGDGSASPQRLTENAVAFPGNVRRGPRPEMIFSIDMFFLSLVEFFRFLVFSFVFSFPFVYFSFSCIFLYFSFSFRTPPPAPPEKRETDPQRRARGQRLVLPCPRLAPRVTDGVRVIDGVDSVPCPRTKLKQVPGEGGHRQRNGVGGGGDGALDRRAGRDGGGGGGTHGENVSRAVLAVLGVGLLLVFSMDWLNSFPGVVYVVSVLARVARSEC